MNSKANFDKIDLRTFALFLESALMAFSLRYYELIHNLISPNNEKKQINLKLIFHLSNIGYYLTFLTLAFKILCYYFEHTFPTYFLLNIFIIEMGTTLGFWFLFIKDTKLLFDADRGKNPWYIHMINESPKHLIPFIVLFIEILFEGFPAVKWTNIIFLLIFITTYWGISEIYTILTGTPLYNILTQINIVYRYLLYCSVILIPLLMYACIHYTINI